VENAAQSKAMMLTVLNGEVGPARDIVLLNAGAAIYVAGLVESLQAGVARAAQVIDDGAARAKLGQLVELSARS
jgi:anthranilate phosphoribosyltransferase